MVAADERGFPYVGSQAPVLERLGLRALPTSLRLLGTALREAPELAARCRGRGARASGALSRAWRARQVS
jgi:hypothetical protein